MSRFIPAFFISFFIALLFTPLAIRLARRLKFLDHPNYRKIHRKDTPLLGGVVLYFAFLVCLIFLTEFSFWYFLILLSGATVILLVGLIDDYLSLGASLKFLLPLAPLLVLVSLGFRVNFLSAFLSFWFVLVWLIGLSNAFNFIDNMNGLAAGTGFLAAFFLGISSLLGGYSDIAIISFALAGGTLGFLPYNFPRAKIFLGDTGSMFLGFMLSLLLALHFWDGTRLTAYFFLAFLVVGYPLFDGLFVALRRLRYNQPPWVGDKNHTSHCLAALFKSKTKAVLFWWLVSFLLGLISLWARQFDFAKILILTAVLCGLAILAGLWLSLKIGFIKRGEKCGAKQP